MTDNTTPVKEIKIPVADPNDPYAIPAAMPSSVDHAVRSFNAGDYPEPSRKQDEWRYTPIERINEFFTVFKPSGETQIEVSMIDGSPLAEGVKLSQIKLGEGLSGTVSKPNDRVSAVEWESGRTATILELSGEIAQPVLVKVHGAGEDLDAFHLVIAAADKAHADVVVEHDGDARLAEGVEITTGKDSHVSTTFVQEWAKTAKHVANHRIHVGEGASLRHSVVTLGGDIVRIRMDQDFGGEQGDLNMLGIYFVDPGEHIEHRTMVVHNHPDCKSRVVYKARLTARARTPLGGQRAHPAHRPRHRLLRAQPQPGPDPGRHRRFRAEPRNRKRQHHRCRSRLFGGPLRRRGTVLSNPAASPKPTPASSWCAASSANSSRKSAFPPSPNI
mgnify:CR=1 FL=1